MVVQWHPLFVSLLRPLLEKYFEIQTDVAVGHLPRQADLLVLKRKHVNSTPFQEIWRNLTPWNILEYKGPTVSARLEHLASLAEVGLGIRRRLNEERMKRRQKALPAAEVSFWYLAHGVGRRLVKQAEEILPGLETAERGVWRSQVVGHPFFLVNAKELPLTYESFPFHLLGTHTAPEERALVRLIQEEPGLWDVYGHFTASLHPGILKEFWNMARSKTKGPRLRLKPLIEFVGMDELIRQVGLRQVVAEVGVDRLIHEIGRDRVFDYLLETSTPAERERLKRQLQGNVP